MILFIRPEISLKDPHKLDKLWEQIVSAGNGIALGTHRYQVSIFVLHPIIFYITWDVIRALFSVSFRDQIIDSVKLWWFNNLIITFRWKFFKDVS